MNNDSEKKAGVIEMSDMDAIIRLVDQEPDRLEWVDDLTGLDCLARRNVRTGTWCGYVIIDDGHPLWGHDAHDLPEDVHAACHGGVTWADGDEDARWLIGFDCYHEGDISPVFGGPYGVYRDLGFVRDECASLARALTPDPSSSDLMAGEEGER